VIRVYDEVGDVTDTHGSQAISTSRELPRFRGEPRMGGYDTAKIASRLEVIRKRL